MGKGGTLGWLKPARAIVSGFALLLLVALALSGGLQIHREPDIFHLTCEPCLRLTREKQKEITLRTLQGLDEGM